MSRHAPMIWKLGFSVLLVCLTIGAGGCFQPPTVGPITMPDSKSDSQYGEVEKPSEKSAFGELIEQWEDEEPPEDKPGVSGQAVRDTNPGQIVGKMDSPWAQVEAPITGQQGNRSAQQYLQIIEQFDVKDGNHCRYYTPAQNSACSGPSDTRCNIFAGDVMRAMGIPLPTKGDLGVGHGTSKDTDPMTANAEHLNLWLNNQMGDGGSSAGWRAIDPTNPADLELLRDHLASGKPALASDPGHIAVLRPDGLPAQITPANLGGLHVAQAGATLSENVPMSSVGYGTGFNPTIFIHE